MPKKRKKNTQKLNALISILCEGEKTEVLYFRALIKDQLGSFAQVKVVDTTPNTHLELVTEACKYKKNAATTRDQVWVVVDKDGYTKHAEAFDKAESNDIRIAFSSIAFEFWFLLHYEYTTRFYVKSEAIISDLKHKHKLCYSKNDRTIYEKIKHLMANAKNNANKLRKSQEADYPGTPLWKLDAFTNVDELIGEIEKATTHRSTL